MRALESPSVEEYDQGDERFSPKAESPEKKFYDDIKVKLYPNPTSGNRTMLKVSSMPGHEKWIDIALMDPFGSIISQRKLNYPDTYLNIPVGDLDRLNPGVYYVRLRVDHLLFNQKLIVE